ncbi:LysR family transcriptional regulator [Klebsiella aerogenes]|uniref:LysR family transcriptional regulator n=1 Tax=Klebsiella aerogenes TaxID=548 RepID=UPI00063C9C3B|nr:LysR family transcriptional regulator [Klebsiella aerogenes]KLF28661.1 LysR family transcriptional regulator [Klebsiella aerogenes]
MVETLDIKVLRVIHMLVTSGSVTKTAELMNVSPGAISYMLNKARQATGSALFSRTHNGMTPDNIAKELSQRYLEVTKVFADDSGAISLQNRAVTICTYSLLEFMLAHALSDKKDHPAMLEFCRPEINSEDRVRRIRSKEVDIDIGTRLPTDRSIIQIQLFSSNLCIFMSKNNPLSKHKFTLRNWRESNHVRWSRKADFICDDYQHANRFNEIMAEKNISMISSDSLNMSLLCAFSDHVMLMPAILSSFLEKHLPIVSRPPPAELQMRFDCYMHFHHSLSGDKTISAIFEKLQQTIV